MSPLHLVPRPAPTLADAIAAADRIRATRVTEYIAALELARILSDEIAAPDAGYPPGIRDIARREAERLKASGDTITSLAGRRA